MNKHDSERVAGMLDALGCEPVAEPTAKSPLSANDTAPDIIIFMTCCVREAADRRLLGQVASLKNSAPDAVICVGGCIGQRDGAKLVEQMPHIDVVFGTHNVAHLPQLISGVLEGRGAQVEVIDAAGGTAETSDLPAHREQAWHGWVSIMTGCNNFCTYCVVPYVRGRETSREMDSVLSEVDALVAGGVQEITLLGQNVNSYGRDIYGQPRFAELLRAVAQSGVARVRFTTSHPKDLSPQTIEVFASEPAIMPQLHLPVQSGSDRIIKAMNRHYSVEHYLDLVHQVRESCMASGKGDVALSTDLIVGFPGESEEDFAATLELVRQVGYAQAFTFIYSKREGTPAARMVDDTPSEVIHERFERLVALVQQTAFASNQVDLGATLPVLFEGASKRDAGVLAGKSPKQQTVHTPLLEGKAVEDFVGRIFDVRITEAKTWYLKGELV